MDRFRRKRKRDTGQKKVLLSIVDPWDDRLASVDPVGLAKRRGVSLSALPSCRDDCSNCDWPTYGSPVRIPSPWYKPPSSAAATTATGSSISSPPPYERTSSQGTSIDERNWPHRWYSDTRSPSPRQLGSTSASLFSGSIQYSEEHSPRDNGRPSSTRSSPSGANELIGPSRRVARYGTPEDAAVIARIHYENERGNGSPSRTLLGNSPIPRVLVTGPPDDEPKTDRYSGFPVPAEDVEAELFPRNSPKLGGKCAESARNGFGADELDSSLNGNDSAEGKRLIDERASVVDIVQTLVESRYSPVTAAKRRANRTSSIRRHQFLKDAFLTGNSKFDSQSTGSFDTEDEERREAIANGTSETRREFCGPIRRKTSISMPSKLDDMNDLANNRQQGTASQFTRVGSASSSSVTFSNSGSTPNGSALGSETEEEANDEELVKVPLQAPPRKKGRSVSPSITPKMGDDPMEIPGVQSANSTITSVNSISSLLKEKLQLSIPQALRRSKKRQNADYRLRAFVGILFLCVVFLVGFAHIYYTQHVLQRAYFDKFRFNKNERAMHIYSNTGAEIIAAKLGVGIPADTGVYPCLPQHQSTNAVCLEWLQQARLYLGHTRKTGMHCYHVIWQSLSPYYNPTDCFDWSLKRGHWYGAGQIQNMPYPLERGRLEFSPFITGDIRKHPFGNVLKRYFLNSKGSTVLVDPKTPLYVSINANRTTDFCLQAKHDNFAYINHLTPLPQLNYTICSTDNMKSLHSLMAEKTLWDGLKPDELQAVHSLLSEPVWQISPTNEVLTYNYTEDVMALGFFKQGHVLLSEEWQPSMGDFMLDEERFPTMFKTIDIIHRRGFKIVFTIQPFISTESVNFRDAVANRLLISERGSDPRIPALTRYKQSNSAGVLDITNNKTLPWLQTKLESLITKYKMDSFYLDLGTAQDMPHYYKCEQPLTNPDHYKTLFANSILSALPVIGVSSAISRPRAPVFVSLPPFPSSWKAIKTVIPTVLSYGVIGFPFIMPGAVGGDVALPMSDNNPDNDFEVSLPDKELYVRWLQLSTFLPVIRFTHLPSKYSDDSVVELAKRLTALRQKTVTPLLKKYANETLDTGLPIIRPLWMLDPADPACHVVVDEFSVGEELIVAPILYSGSRQREVYLPAGVWRDGIDGSLRKGSRWIHNYRVAEDKVAYFVKMPDNTRF